MKNKNVLCKGAAVLFFVFFFSVFMACDSYSLKAEAAHGNVIKEQRDVPSFNEINIGGAVKVVLVQGTEEMVVVEADEEVMELVITEVSNNSLRISSKLKMKNPEKVLVTVYFKDLTSIVVGGAVDVSNEATMNFAALNMQVGGASEIAFNMEVKNLNIDLEGASEVNLQGNSDNANIEISGASELDALSFEINNLVVEASGASEATVNAIKSLVVEISGASEVKYKQGPPIFKSHVSGSGNLRKL